MGRAIIIVLDSVGCGGARDAAEYGDEGADTLGHIAEACAAGKGDREGLREGPLSLPNLDRLGLGLAMHASTGRRPPGFACHAPTGQWGYGVETSRGKDTPSGHWEIAGTPVDFAWGYFPLRTPAFPPELTRDLIARAKLTGILGDCHASGTEIIERFGEEHLRTLKPICYTSVDSVLQIAAHEEAFGLERLYDVCRVARALCDPLNIGRVIARPFLGERAGEFARTANRKDFSIPPLPGNLLARAAQGGREIVTVGKIGDIFAHRDTGLGTEGQVQRRARRSVAARPARDRRRRVDLRQSRRFRHRIRPSPRCGGLCGLPGGVRPSPAADPSGAARAGFLRHHRRPRQRSDLARL